MARLIVITANKLIYYYLKRNLLDNFILNRSKRKKNKFIYFKFTGVKKIG